jgi:hypothetical protein
LTGPARASIIVFIPTTERTMHNPSPNQPSSSPSAAQPSEADVAKVRAWLKLRQEMAELHAQLEYLKLMMTLGVSS